MPNMQKKREKAGVIQPMFTDAGAIRKACSSLDETMMTLDNTKNDSVSGLRYRTGSKTIR